MSSMQRVFFALILAAAADVVLNETMKRDFMSVLLQNYEGSTPPDSGGGKPTVVQCNIYINSLYSVDENTMDYSMNIYLREMWHDRRLKFEEYSNVSSVVLHNKLFDKIWVPDIFFPNDRHAQFHEVTMPNRLVRIYRNGDILMSQRLTLRVSCFMDLYKFPLDEQHCNMEIATYSFTTDTLVLEWRAVNPVEVNKNLQLPEFKLISTKVKIQRRVHSTGTYSGLEVEFILKRQFGYYFIQVYVPSVLIVILAFVSFWIDSDATPARISLGVLTVLTMTTQKAGVRDMPKVSYVKAIDVWNSACLTFVFAALLEFAVVNVLARKEHKRRRRSASVERERSRARERERECEQERSQSEEKDDDAALTGNRIRCLRNCSARDIDKVARKCFPAAFILFNLIYWVLYLLVI